MPNNKEKLVKLFYENNVKCDQTVEGLADDVESIITDVAEVRRGEWVTKETALGTCCICSVCGSCPTMEYRYCPYCGARMDEGLQMFDFQLRLCGNQYKYCNGDCRHCDEPEYHATNSIQRDVTNG